MRFALTLTAMLLAALATTFAPAAHAHDPYYPLRESPQCSDPAMLKQIVKGFAHKAKNQLLQPELGIADISGVHQHRYVPQEPHRARPIPRRYCHATVQMTDGRERKVWYLIEGGAGFASMGSKVEFCVSGYDRWNVYNAACRILR